FFDVRHSIVHYSHCHALSGVNGQDAGREQTGFIQLFLSSGKPIEHQSHSGRVLRRPVLPGHVIGDRLWPTFAATGHVTDPAAAAAAAGGADRLNGKKSNQKNSQTTCDCWFHELLLWLRTSVENWQVDRLG